MKRRIWALLAALCALVALAVMWPGRSGDFVFDDQPNIVDNQRVHLEELSWVSLKRASSSYEPGHGSRQLAMVSFALDHWRAGGLHAATFKETNLFIHGLTVVLLGAFLRRLLRTAQWSAPRADAMALGLALAWGVHPLQVSAVLYVVQRMQTLSTLFLVLALWAYLGARLAQQSQRRSLWHWCLFALSGLLGLACKEDVLLLPGFTWILELTVLRFQAADARQTALWRTGYRVLVGLGAIAFLLVVIPRYWTWEPYAWRNFSSLERLLTQARVLMMYLGQMALPLPKLMPFYYDHLEPSRGLLSPPTTLASLVLLAGLLGWAWCWRLRRPVFAAGVMLFFMGHFLTSNVLNLELAFEHRNHFPLIGFLLAAGDLACLAVDRLRPSRGLAAFTGGAVVLTLCVLTFIRASIWGSSLQFALQGPDWAPDSPRAWQLLCKAYYQRSGGDPGHPLFSLAIRSCQKAADMPDELVTLGDLITLKTIQGQDTRADWQLLEERLRDASITPEGRDVIWILIGNHNKGVPLDSHRMVRAIAAFAQRIKLSPVELANLANFVLYQSTEPEQAYSYFERSLREAPAADPIVDQILRDLSAHGMEEWAQRLRKGRSS